MKIKKDPGPDTENVNAFFEDELFSLISELEKSTNKQGSRLLVFYGLIPLIPALSRVGCATCCTRGSLGLSFSHSSASCARL